MNEKLETFDFFHLRLPSLSFERIIELNCSSSKEELAGKLYQLYQSLDMQDAIYLASPELYHLLLKWLGGNTIIDIEPKLLITLYKYALRMGTRSTPFGLFAGVSTGSVVYEPSSVKLKDKNSVHKRLDMDYTADIAIQIARDKSIKENLSFFLNTSLYKTQDGYRFYECRHEANKRKYFLTSVKASYYIDLVLDIAKTGINYSELIKKLHNEDIPDDLARAFIDNLISDQLLVSELEPTVTGDEFQKILLNKLKTLDTDKIYLCKLELIDKLCGDDISVVQLSESITDILNQFSPLGEKKNLLQVDLKINTINNQINKRVMNIISKELSEIAPLNNSSVSEDLNEFKKRFFDRYEEREVPLLEAIDADLGVGYGTSLSDFHTDNPLVKELNPHKANIKNKSESVLQKLLLNKFLLSKEKSSKEVEITKDELESLNVKEASKTNFPSTLYAMGNLIAESCSAMDEGNFLFNLSAFGGPSAVSLMARFGHLEPALAHKLKECTVFEEADNLILAEIIHLPESRVGNILQRPKIRRYEIPFLGMSNMPVAQQMPIEDIVVSVKSDKVILRSKKLGLEIRPHLSCAHNYQNGISVYRFLSDLQHQHHPFSINWDWEDLSDQTFLPRVFYKHLVLSRARWSFQTSVLIEYKNLQSRQDQEQFLKKYAIPQQVMLAEGDNELLIDFYSPLGMEILINKLKKGKVILFEVLFSDTTSIVKDSQGLNYLNEIIIPLRSKQKQHSLVERGREKLDVKRSFVLGSDWIYVKIYCGIKQADKILIENILPLVESLQKDKIILKWFFIRYNDPENHIRLRFQIKEASPTALTSVLYHLNKNLDLLFESGIIYRIQYDTYNREIERYGQRTMEVSETIFGIDSHASINLLLNLNKEKNIQRWHLAVYGIDQLLDTFGLEPKSKLSFVTSARDSYFKEFNGDKKLNYQLNSGYREHATGLECFLNELRSDPDKQLIYSVFDKRSQGLKEMYEQLRYLLKDDVNIKDEIVYLLQSYCHMFLNRMFYVDQRLHELVVYHYLMKHYSKFIAREKRV